MIFTRTHLLCSLLLSASAMQLQGMSPLKCDQLIGAFDIGLGLSELASADCTGEYFRCQNLTQDTCQVYCIPVGAVFKHWKPWQSCQDASYKEAPQDTVCTSKNLFRLCLASIPVALNGAVIGDAIYRKLPFGCEKIMKMAVCTVAYTATCLYAYENYTNGGDVAGQITGWFVVGGNAAITHYLAH